MKKSAFFALSAALGAVLLSTSALADTASFRGYARVVSVTPVVKQVRVTAPPNCYPGHAQVQSSDAGPAIAGAVIGGVVGSRFGGGSGRDAATALGVIGGAIIGNNMASGSAASREVCESRVYYESQQDGYDVVYDLGGYQGTLRTDEFPGRDIPVEIRITPLVSTYRSNR